MNDESKESKKQSTMSLAAKKAWETRRKKYGIKPRGEKKERNAVLEAEVKFG